MTTEIRRDTLACRLTRLLALLTAATAATPATAETLQHRWKLDGKPGSSCYARVYDAGHLAAHPHQRLTSFALGPSSIGQPETPEPGTFELSFAFTVKGDRETYQSQGICRSVGKRLECGVEADGGSFSLRAEGDGLLLTVGSSLTVEGSRDMSPDLGVGGDDRVVRLHPASRSACRFR